MSLDLSTTSVAVAGGAGFLGRAVIARLNQEGCKRIGIPRSRDFDLRSEKGASKFYDHFKPDIVIHLAASVGGIGANQQNPGKFFYDNAVMGLQLIEFGRRCGLQKFVAVGTVCSYPKFTPIPFKEENLWDGYPEETNAPYGIAKKMLLVQSQAYRDQYGFNAIFVIPVNLYGPHEKFSLESSHVIPAIIRKCVEAKFSGQSQITLWGDGAPTREFLYVEDAADGIVRATIHYDGREPINLGSGVEISIRDLAEKIRALVGYEGQIAWDTLKPNGQPRRCLDTSRARELFGFEAQTSLDDGLKVTHEWYLQNRQTILNEDNPQSVT